MLGGRHHVDVLQPRITRVYHVVFRVGGNVDNDASLDFEGIVAFGLENELRLLIDLGIVDTDRFPRLQDHSSRMKARGLWRPLEKRLVFVVSSELEDKRLPPGAIGFAGRR